MIDLFELIEIAVTSSCDEFKIPLDPNAVYRSYGKAGEDYCGHSIGEHGSDGCAGSWLHSRCGQEHPCRCKCTRSDLIKKVLADNPIAEVARIRALRELMGYVQDGSHTTVSVGQDDATMEFILSAGRGPGRWWHGPSLENVLDQAVDTLGDQAMETA